MKTKKQILEELKPKNIDFKVDLFEELILQDIAKFDNETQIKLNRNLTQMFNSWLTKKLKAKEQIKVAIKGETRSGKCVSKFTPILMADKTYTLAKDIKLNDKVISFTQNGKITTNKVINILDSGLKNSFNVKIWGGFNINCSEEHKFLTLDDTEENLIWKKLKDLKKGDFLGIPYNYGEKEKDKIDLDKLKLYELIGYLLGDGSLSIKNRIYFTSSYNSVIERIKFLLPNDMKINEIKGNKYGYGIISKKRLYDEKGYLLKSSLMKTLIKYNLMGCNSYTKFIPTELINDKNEYKYALLNGLFSSDGGIEKKKGLLYSSVSKELINNISTILFSLGINHNLREKKISYKYKDNSKRILYIIEIGQTESLLKIQENCNLNHKQEKLNLLLEKRNNLNPQHKQIKINDILFRRIKSIENLHKKEEMVDFEIENNHNFVANNLIIHNSLIGLKIIKKTTDFYEYLKFDTEKQVCANQKELKQKLQDCEFGESFLIDENAFANTGMGSMTEIQQLKDINNIIAKQNNHMVYITPKMFLDVGATLGLAYWGKDTKNWLSRFLLYSLKANSPTLLGYVVFDVGSLFQETGCLIYNKTGGCTNPQRLLVDEIGKDYIENSECIPKKYNKKDLIENKKQCPFYNLCNSQMCHYEKKKDKWIDREMKGGLGEREIERIEIAIKLFTLFAIWDSERSSFRFKAKNGKELKLKIGMKIPLITNSKLTGTEKEEIMTLMLSLLDFEMLEDTCKLVGKDHKEILEKIQKGEYENEEN